MRTKGSVKSPLTCAGYARGNRSRGKDEVQMKDAMILEAKGLSKSFGKERAVRSLDLKIERGEIYCLLGPNGAGKTTTLKMLLGFLKPSAGSVSIEGEPVEWNGKGPRGRVGAMIETPAFYDHLSGRDNLMVVALLHGGIEEARVRKVLQLVGLGRVAKKKVGAYSLGMRQRLAIARALLSDPELLVLDEPTNGLDPAGMREIRQLLQLLARQHGKTILLSSHLLGEVEKIYSRVGIIHRGRLIEEFDREKLAVLEKNRMPFEDYFLSLTEGADVL